MNALLFSRTIDAPQALVFAAWTDPKALEQWFGPHGFQSHSAQLDPRPGGSWSIVMRGPDGTDYPTRGHYREVDAPNRLVYTTILENETGEVILDVLITVTFTQAYGKTALTLTADVVRSTSEAAPMLAGMEEGWSQTLDRMQEHAVQTTRARSKHV